MNDGDVIQHATPTILGRYRLNKQIGRGGMGDVWLGEDPRLHRQVAIKTLPIRKQQDEEFVLRFEREARAAAALNHPHILPIHDFGKQALPDGRVIAYIVMPYITGGTLADRIAAHSTRQVLMPQHEAITYLTQAAEAIDHAHKHGIVHRDIKPGNMLLRHDNWLLLGDFGIARLLSSTENLTRTGVAGAGTPEYMAPEQAQSRATASSDIYSLAVLTYYLFTGQLPFSAETGFATSILHMTSAPPSPRKINPALSPSQESVLLHGLAKRPEERPASAGALVAALQQVTNAASYEVTRQIMINQSVTGNSLAGNNQFPVTGQSHMSRNSLASNNQVPFTGQSHLPRNSLASNNQLPSTGQSQIRGNSLASNHQVPFTGQSHMQRPLMQSTPASLPAGIHPDTEVPGAFNSAYSATKKRISRRTMFIGGSTALALLGGGIWAWTATSNIQKSGSTSKTGATSDPNGPDLILKGHTRPVTSLTWSSQSTATLASAAEDGTVLLWQIKQPQQQLGVKLSPFAKQSFQPSGPLQLSWSSDGRLLAIGNSGKGKSGTSASIDIYTGDLQKAAPGYNTSLIIAGVSSIASMGWENHYLISIGAQPSQTSQKQLQLNLWDTQQPSQPLEPVAITGNLSTNISNRSPILLVSPDNSSLALAEAEGVVIGQVKPSGTITQWQQLLGPVKPDGQIKAISWMPDSTALTVLVTKNDKDFSLAYWTAQKLQEQYPLSTDAVLTTIAWCPAATSGLIAIGSKDGRVLIWNFKGSNIPASLDSNLNAEVTTLAWTTDGQWLAAGYNDKDASILVWNIQGRGI